MSYENLLDEEFPYKDITFESGNKPISIGNQKCFIGSSVGYYVLNDEYHMCVWFWFEKFYIEHKRISFKNILIYEHFNLYNHNLSLNTLYNIRVSGIVDSRQYMDLKLSRYYFGLAQDSFANTIYLDDFIDETV